MGKVATPQLTRGRQENLGKGKPNRFSCVFSAAKQGLYRILFLRNFWSYRTDVEHFVLLRRGGTEEHRGHNKTRRMMHPRSVVIQLASKRTTQHRQARQTIHPHRAAKQLPRLTAWSFWACLCTAKDALTPSNNTCIASTVMFSISYSLRFLYFTQIYISIHSYLIASTSSDVANLLSNWMWEFFCWLVMFRGPTSQNGHE